MKALQAHGLLEGSIKPLAKISLISLEHYSLSDGDISLAKAFIGLIFCNGSKGRETKYFSLFQNAFGLSEQHSFTNLSLMLGSSLSP